MIEWPLIKLLIAVDFWVRVYFLKREKIAKFSGLYTLFTWSNKGYIIRATGDYKN